MTILRTTEPRGTFRVTYETVTAESAEQGEYADSGWLDWLGSPVDQYSDSVWDLRDLADKLAGCSAEGDGDRVPRWITLDPGSDFWLAQSLPNARLASPVLTAGRSGCIVEHETQP